MTEPPPPITAPRPDPGLDLLFAGSSIFEQWPQAATLLPGVHARNAAIGGTHTVDWLPTLGPMVRRFQPRVLCLYVGSNDIAQGRATREVICNLQQLLADTHRASADTATLYFSIIRSADKADRYLDLDEVEAAVREHCASMPNDRAAFVDSNPVFFTPATERRSNAKPPSERYTLSQLKRGYFLEDRVHLTPTAYEALTRYAAPIVHDALNKPVSARPR
ncbi:MAG: GDSL-type esterase/lipase family protein [Planctomycetota bacterium]